MSKGIEDPAKRREYNRKYYTRERRLQDEAAQQQAAEDPTLACEPSRKWRKRTK